MCKNFRLLKKVVCCLLFISVVILVYIRKMPVFTDGTNVFGAFVRRKAVFADGCHISRRLTAIMAMPPTTPAMAMWCLPYFSAVGRSSSREMYIMMPATAARMSGNAAPPPVSSSPKTEVTARQRSAPITSLNPERVA